MSLGSPIILNEMEDTFGAQTLNRTPSFVTSAPNSNVHDFLDVSILFFNKKFPSFYSLVFSLSFLTGPL